MESVISKIIPGLRKPIGNLKFILLSVYLIFYILRIQLFNKELNPPFVPKVSDEGDSSQFDSYQDINMEVSEKCKYEREFADF